MGGEVAQNPDNADELLARIYGKLPYADRVKTSTRKVAGIDGDLVARHVERLKQQRQDRQASPPARAPRKPRSAGQQAAFANMQQQKRDATAMQMARRIKAEAERARLAALNERWRGQEKRRRQMEAANKPRWRTLTVKRLVTMASDFYDVSELDILTETPNRQAARGKKHVVHARHAVIWAADELLRLSKPQIGRRVCRNHTTVHSALRKPREQFQPFLDHVQEQLK